MHHLTYCQTANIRHTLICNKLVDHSDVVGASPAGAWGGWGCEVSCGGHHRLRGKTTTGSALDGAVFDITQILAYLVLYTI